MIPLNKAKWIFIVQDCGENDNYDKPEDDSHVFIWEVEAIEGNTGLCEDDSPEIYSRETFSSSTNTLLSIRNFVKVNNISNFEINFK